MRLPGQPKDKRELISARGLSYVLLGVILAGLLLAFRLGSVPLVVLGTTVLAFWAFHYVFITRVLWPTGDSTPADKGLSHIEAMVARGDYSGAAAAYRAEIASDPEDYRSCERLALLAREHLRDAETALWAYREAEKRVMTPRRRAGFALQAAGVLRDDLKDMGRAVVELRRVLATYPDIPNADQLRAELEQLKASHFGPP